VLKCLPTEKSSSPARFEGMVSGTDFHSVVETTWLRPVKREKTYCRKVSNLHYRIETDFDSVVMTTWLRPVKISL
jgi:hypothetical protein